MLRTPDRRKILKHLEALTALFIINSIEPTAESSGEAIYFLCDVGLARHLDAGFDQRLRTWVVLEVLSQLTYAGYSTSQCVFTYRTEKGSRIDLVIKEANHYTALKVYPFEGLIYQDLEILRAFHHKFERSKVFALCTQADIAAEKFIHIIPWENIG